MAKPSSLLLLPFSLLLPLCLPISLALSDSNSSSTATTTATNPFSPKAAALRYWSKKTSGNLPRPDFLVSKLSPLTPAKSAAFLRLADENTLSTKLPAFCYWAHLFCFPDMSTSLAKHRDPVDFLKYTDQNFTNYGTSGHGGVSSFKNYSVYVAFNSFGRYSRDSAGRSDKFAFYTPEFNIGGDDFSGYGVSAKGGSSDFNNYDFKVNIPDLNFTSYGSESAGRPQTFTSYSNESNSGEQTFSSYGKSGTRIPTNFASYGKSANVIQSTFTGYGKNAKADGIDLPQSFTSYNDDANAGAQSFSSYGKSGTGMSSDFASYGNNSNVIGSTFTGYGKDGIAATSTFTSYAFNGNVPQNNFSSYGDGGKGLADTFTSYRDTSNVGDDTFSSYAKNSNSTQETFINYGHSVNIGTDTFKLYGKGAANQHIGFKTYGVNTTFTDYTDKKTISFATYNTTPPASSSSSTARHSSISSNKWLVEEGKFFRESALKQGNAIKMPDIEDKMPERSFLPRSIAEKIPFSSARLGELLRVFNSEENSALARMVKRTLGECERAPSRGETKRCVASAEDMIDFAVEVLGREVTVKTTEGLGGNKGTVEIGRVEGINGGRITKSVSCHQSLFPYLVYFCHSVPKVRVYEADILDSKTKQKINRGLAICHIDTSAWGPGHGAFIALGGAPGKIEVCHWIFQNDMTWVVADY